MKIRICSVLMAAAPALLAAEAPSARDALLACAEVREGVARLDCYDAAAAAQRSAAQRPTPAQRAAPVPVPPAASAPAPGLPAPPATGAPVAAAASTATLGEEQLKRSAQSADVQDKQLHARIASTRKGASGTYLVTLDNGQVWRHEEGSMAEYLLVGKAVTIRPGSLGSYRLSLDEGSSKNWVRVTRVR